MVTQVNEHNRMFTNFSFLKGLGNLPIIKMRCIFRKRVPSSYACSSKKHSEIWERNGKEGAFKQYPTRVLGAQMVPDLTKPPCTEIQQDKRRYAENLDFKPFSHWFINICEDL